MNHLEYFVETRASFTGDIVDVFIVMEYCTRGDLHHFIANRKVEKTTMEEAVSTSISPRILYSWVYQLLSAIQFLHEQKIVHRGLEKM